MRNGVINSLLRDTIPPLLASCLLPENITLIGKYVLKAPRSPNSYVYFSKEPHNFYSLPDTNRVISRSMRWAVHENGTRGRDEKCIQRILSRKCEGKESHGRPWRMWDENIKMNLK